MLASHDPASTVPPTAAPSATTTTIAYFSMEVGLDEALPTYSGGLGLLAGDSLRAAADLGMRMVGVSLLHRKGYFFQTIGEDGWQREHEVRWEPGDFLRPLAARASVRIEGREVRVGAWAYDVRGVHGHVVPVLLLDTDLPENAPEDRTLTHWLYGGDHRYRFKQEVVLGVGGVRVLRALGYSNLQRFHMNEGHAALLVYQLLREQLEAAGAAHIDDAMIERVRRRCVFTTHTPVAAGHDRFAPELVREVGGTHEAFERTGLFTHEGQLNMTYAAMNLSHYVNGVAKKHGEVSRAMFPGYCVDAITNGVHAGFWAGAEMASLFDRHMPGWRTDHSELRHALGIDAGEVALAHACAKRRLIDMANDASNAGLDRDYFTIGFARRFTAYKRPALVLHDMERLARIAGQRPVQLIFAGKAHPRDEEGKRLIQRVLQACKDLRDRVRIAFVPNYDIGVAKLLVAGCDLWLNTPEPPLEASGTSGMKAAVNGVPSLSTLDGWWIEGFLDGSTGWSITGADAPAQASSLYDTLERVILPLYFSRREMYDQIRRNCIAINGAYFNTHRMMQQYAARAYSV